MKYVRIDYLTVLAFSLDQLVLHQMLEAFDEIEVIDQAIADDDGADVGVIQGIPDFIEQI